MTVCHKKCFGLGAAIDYCNSHHHHYHHHYIARSRSWILFVVNGRINIRRLNTILGAMVRSRKLQLRDKINGVFKVVL